MINLTGKVILVTGASRGIGAVTALTCARAGASVVVHYHRSAEAAEHLAAKIGPERAVTIGADLGERDAARELFSRALGWQGRVDALVNNAAIFMRAGVLDPEDRWREAWERTMQVNLYAAADLCREAINHFLERGVTGADPGMIVNISSRAAWRGEVPEAMHYAASKGALISLTKTIARHYASRGILAFGIAPGFVRTEMADEAGVGFDPDWVRRELPMGAMAEPEDVANTVAFLVSGLAPHLTGATLDINGASYVR